MITYFDFLVNLTARLHDPVANIRTEIGLERFMSVTAWSKMIGYNPNSLFLPEPGLTYPSSIGFNGSLKFTLDDGFTVEIPNSELQHPLRGLDEGGDYALQSM